MELPPTIYIGLGAVLAAIITAVISFINLIASKDQKTSEFRQQWIDDLRADISGYLSNVNIVACEAHLYQQIKGENGITKELLKEFAGKVSTPMNDAFRLFHSVQLRLNTKDDAALLQEFKNMNSLFDDALNNIHDTKKVERITSSIIEKSQVILKSEWKRVKKGEASFYLTKYFAAFVVISFAIGLGIYFSEYLEVSITLSGEK
ncbi:hypothetical protein GSF04_00155 [Pseudoalteromonas sp. A22]|uniref:hypothetical protein n=1 Tax=Pseudoalteromonas TaxID=53246 RepID=UPI001BA704AA|nr:hypothetical protein [Pseudoalteromonas sp. A22]QUI60987.1 hypothetical protein GSF04_00155 [Pseudoalteromonas sp. A22]